ncbi:non-heme iron oxygenase ferredoxin subunit (plasmid) [Rhodococcus sp. DK180]|uniref:Ferredoxin n=1 Tax=Rhodococcus jostii (strain RHA1) TaxID=101510 RepID=Q75WN3_RHOJR|nr:non-heme iron oxygenase ferredoxin subunit [Rhodococcus jostii]AAR90141.1 alkylbenzene dioxygenase [Rhodococcus sp. DK17]ABH00338.1 ethylbenzene dioxygenase, ferredoxin component [Rhodococcus jostii RHA1]BAC92720.1 ferredoxin [Rhodococcus jostii RHA1]
MVWTSPSNKESTTADLIRLCCVDEVTEGKPVALNPPGLPPLAAYRVGDDYFVTHNVCTHSYSLLTDGFQEGEVIECEVHGGTFDIRSGAATGFPCRTALKTFDVVLIEGWITIVAPGAESQ